MKELLKQIFSLVSVSVLFVTLINIGPMVSATVPYNNSKVSLDASGNQANDASSYEAGSISVSKDGRYTTFSSTATNLVSGDTNGFPDIFVKDKVTGSISRVNVYSNGAQSTSDGAIFSKISADGRFVAFTTTESIDGSDTTANDLYVRDLVNTTTELVSVRTSQAYMNINDDFDISGDGRYIVFSTTASNLVSGDTNSTSDVFVRDRMLGTTTLLTKTSGGTLGNGYSKDVSISCEGSIIAFNSAATNLVSGDTNGYTDTFILNRVGGDNLKNITIGGNASSSFHLWTDVSCDGSNVAFVSTATNLVSPNLSNNKRNVFVYNNYAQSVSIASLRNNGSEANDDSYYPTISSDGSYLAFQSNATDLVAGDTNSTEDVFLRDRVGATTERVSMRNSSTEASIWSVTPTMTLDGRYILYTSRDTGLVSGDTNNRDDVFRSETGVPACNI